MTITHTHIITYTAEDGRTVKLPFTPLNHFYELPNDGVVVVGNEARFLIDDPATAWSSFEDFCGEDDYIVFRDYSEQRNATPEMLNEVIEELVSEGYKVFPVGKYEHGLVSYSVHGERLYPDMQWDYRIAGVIGVKDVDAPIAAATQYLAEYSAWANGCVYCAVAVPLDNPEEWYSCGGFIGDSALDAIREGF